MLLDSMVPEEMREVAMVFENTTHIGGQLLKSIYNVTLGPEVKSMIKELFAKHVAQAPFVFQGNQHDLSYFWKSPTLSVKDVSTLPPEMQNAVVKTMDVACHNGLLTYSNGGYHLTEQGNRYIHDLNYISNVVRTDCDLSQKMVDMIEQKMPQQPDRFIPRSAAQGTGQTVTRGTTQGTGQAVAQGAGQAVAQGAGQAVAQAAGQAVTQGAGQAVAQGAGQAVAQGAAQTASPATTTATTATASVASGAATAGVGTIATGAIGLASAAGQQVVCAGADALKKTVNSIISR